MHIQKNKNIEGFHWVWAFQGEGANTCIAIYTDKINAENYIKQYALSGILIKMPLNISIYQWAIESGYFSPHKDYMHTSSFIQKFNSAYLEHYHYVCGQPQ